MVYSKWSRWLLCFGILVSTASGEVVYRSMNQLVAGAWEESHGDTMLSYFDLLQLDLNSDAVPDFGFQHDYVLNPKRLTRSSADMLRTAKQGLHSIRQHLGELRGLTFDYGNVSTLSLADARHLERLIDQQTSSIDLVSETTVFGEQSLLDGSSGVSGIASHRRVNFLNGNDRMGHKSFDLQIDQPAERASIVLAALGYPLEQDETIFINGHEIVLFQDMYRGHLVDRINQFRPLTHVFSAFDNEDNLRLMSDRFGATATFEVYSNLDAGTPGSMKIGTEVLTATGVDATGKLGGTEFRGHGDLVTIDSGEAEGISIQLLPGYEDVWRTSLQVGGKVSVIDESLGLQFKNSESEIRHTFPKVDSNVLGLGSSNNRFGNLQEIAISGSANEDAKRLLQNAVQQIDSESAEIDELLANHYLPQASGKIVSFSDNAISADGLVPAGTVIGPDTNFSSVIDVANLSGGGYLGLQVRNDDEIHYGWVRLVVDRDQATRIRGFGLQSEPGIPITVGMIQGDFNGNGSIDVHDIQLLAAAMVDLPGDVSFDLNHDSKINSFDHSHWVHQIANTYYGDANLDGEFNSSDLVKIFAAGEYEDEIALNSTWSEGDFNADGEFDSADLVLAFQDDGYELGPRTRSAIVPEPSSGTWVVAFGCVLLFRRIGRNLR